MGVQQTLLAFLALSLVMTVSPGPNTFLVLRTGLAGGRRSALAVSAGAATGSLAWGIAAALGVAALFQQSSLAYDVVRYAGAAYLAYLGVKTVLARDRASPALTGNAHDPAPARRAHVRRSFREGLLSDLLSPKAGLFFLAILPQFVPTGWPPLPAMLLLTLIDAVLVIAWLSTVSYALHLGSRWLRRPRLHRALTMFSGLALIALAAGVALTGMR